MVRMRLHLCLICLPNVLWFTEQQQGKGGETRATRKRESAELHKAVQFVCDASTEKREKEKKEKIKVTFELPEACLPFPPAEHEGMSHWSQNTGKL